MEQHKAMKAALDDLVAGNEAMLAAIVMMPTLLPGRVGEELKRAEDKVRSAKDHMRSIVDE